MNITDIEASLDYMFEAQLTPMLWGHAGTGKTSLVKRYAETKGYHFFPFYLGAMSDSGDILGLQGFVKDEHGSEVASTFAIPVWLKDAIDYCTANPTSGAVIFLDEFNRARRDILNGMFSFALDKKFHNIQVPKNCHIIAACNPPTDEYTVTDIDDSALMARFVHIKVEPTVNEWVAYAKSKSFEPTLISFIQEQPKLLFSARSEFKLPVKPDNRSVERANQLFKVKTPKNLSDQLLQGILGVEIMVAYQQHLIAKEQPVTGEDVFAGRRLNDIQGWSTPGDVKASYLNKTMELLHDHIVDRNTKDSFFSDVESENLMTFLHTVPKEVAYTLFKRTAFKDYKVIDKFYREPNNSKKLAVLLRELKGTPNVKSE